MKQERSERPSISSITFKASLLLALNMDKGGQETLKAESKSSQQSRSKQYHYSYNLQAVNSVNNLNENGKGQKADSPLRVSREKSRQTNTLISALRNLEQTNEHNWCFDQQNCEMINSCCLKLFHF